LSGCSGFGWWWVVKMLSANTECDDEGDDDGNPGDTFVPVKDVVTAEGDQKRDDDDNDDSNAVVQEGEVTKAAKRRKTYVQLRLPSATLANA